MRTKKETGVEQIRLTVHEESELYNYFRGMTYEEDKDLLGLGFRKKEDAGYEALKNHMCHTYMSFILSGLSDEPGCQMRKLTIILYKAPHGN